MSATQPDQAAQLIAPTHSKRALYHFPTECLIELQTLRVWASNPKETRDLFTKESPIPSPAFFENEEAQCLCLSFQGAVKLGEPVRERLETAMEGILETGSYNKQNVRKLFESLYGSKPEQGTPETWFKKLRRWHEAGLVPYQPPIIHPATFPNLPAEKIPAPAPESENDKGRREYNARQIVEILRPDWEVAALTTHAAHAARIGAHIGSDVTFCPALGWLFWNGRHWETDDRMNTATGARVASLSCVVRAEAAKLYSHSATLAAAKRLIDAPALSKAAGELLKHARQAESKSFIDGALHLAAGVLRCSHSAFDQRPWSIGFQNGTWDKGEWREHRREDRALHLSPVSIDLEAERTEWLAVLERISGGDSDFQRTLQGVAGYALSGASHLRKLPWCYGPGGTGKSTITELLQTVLGGMAATIDPEKLSANSARERLGAQLWNKRVAVCSEAGSQRLEAELLKTLSGSDSLDVRFLFREAFTAPPCHLLIMVANDPPRVDAYDAALKDRVIALPFVHRLDAGDPLKLTGGARIEAVRRDPTSPLVRGFAAWALEGLAQLHKSQEIYLAKSVEKATSRFWAETDRLTPFWETIKAGEHIAEIPGAGRRGILKTGLRGHYETWCQSEGERALSAQQFNKACHSRGLVEDHFGSGKARQRYWFEQK